MQDNNPISVGVKEESSASPPTPRKPSGGGGCDRLKRDEWSEGAVSCLLEAYESKWALRNKAKLKGQDWEDVARHVSSRAGSTKSPKTQTQCKNKIESMKKRYRSESAASPSSWPLFSRIDLLMRGAGGGGVGMGPTNSNSNSKSKAATLMLLETLPPPPCSLTVESNGAHHDHVDKEERVVVGDEQVVRQSSDQVSEGSKKEATLMDNTDSSTPALYESKSSRKKKKIVEKKKKRQKTMGIAESIQVFAEAVVRSEQARMETLREVERMRVEGEARRAEMDLKRTHILANTQLQIAKIFAASSSSAAARSSLLDESGIPKNFI
ncbi:hypothetical protein V2J09_014170 [Rumex salicifolius]